MKFTDMKDKYHGKTVFVIGNGPSLNVLPVQKLAGHYTAACNFFIPYGVEKYSFTPNFWVISAEKYEEHMKNLNKILPLINKNKLHIVVGEDYFSIIDDIKEGWKPPLSSDLRSPKSDPKRIKSVEKKFQDAGAKTLVVPINLLPPRFYCCGVITLTAIPLCAYLGFKKIIFVGMDLGGWNHFYSTKLRVIFMKRKYHQFGICWDGKKRSNIDAIFNLDWAIFARKIPEYNRLIPKDVEFYHTTPRPEKVSFKEKVNVKLYSTIDSFLDYLKPESFRNWAINFEDRFIKKLGISVKDDKIFKDFASDGYYIHQLEDYITYIDFNDALKMTDKV